MHTAGGERLIFTTFRPPWPWLTLDWVQSHSIVYHSSTSTYTAHFVQIEKQFVDGQTYGRAKTPTRKMQRKYQL